MKEIKDAKEPFKFFTRLHLTELTGLKACNLEELLTLLKEVPGSSIYHHTHRFLQQHQYLSPEPPNDFAYWVTQILGEKKLGELLASIDTVQYGSIRALREKLILTIESYMDTYPKSKLKFAGENEEFHFIKSVSFIFETGFVAGNLSEFLEILNKIAIDSIYYHIFESRLRLEKSSNDFSNWFENSADNKKIAVQITKLDPYTYTLEELRKKITRIIEKEIKG